MIASCTQFDFHAPHFEPADAIFVPELIDGNRGGEQALIFQPEHCLQLLERRGEKHAYVLLGYTVVQAEPPQYSLKGGEWA